jgi:hypothetical protein
MLRQISCGRPADNRRKGAASGFARGAFLLAAKMNFVPRQKTFQKVLTRVLKLGTIFELSIEQVIPQGTAQSLSGQAP